MARGFGLMQREREFESYCDLVSNYHERPSLWVEPFEFRQVDGGSCRLSSAKCPLGGWRH